MPSHICDIAPVKVSNTLSASASPASKKKKEYHAMSSWKAFQSHGLTHLVLYFPEPG
jgi:hypothetical protein